MKPGSLKWILENVIWVTSTFGVSAINISVSSIKTRSKWLGVSVDLYANSFFVFRRSRGLHDNDRGPKVIHTVPTSGYSFDSDGKDSVLSYCLFLVFWRLSCLFFVKKVTHGMVGSLRELETREVVSRSRR